ncbi:MAG: hypothetical protein QXY18_02095 [Nitrososphaerota archaeon]
MNKNKKGISIVVATAILISLCLIITIAVVMWHSGIVGTLTTIERVEIVRVNIESGIINKFFIAIDIKNAGEKTVRVCQVSINGKPFKEFSPNTKVILMCSEGKELDPNNEETFLLIEPGEIGLVGISIPENAISIGQKIHIKVHTISGGEYPIVIFLENPEG